MSRSDGGSHLSLYSLSFFPFFQASVKGRDEISNAPFDCSDQKIDRKITCLKLSAITIAAFLPNLLKSEISLFKT